jgi:uncharacterized protein
MGDNLTVIEEPRSLYAPHPDILEFERRFGQLGGVERRLITLDGIETRDTGEGGYSVTGYASVFDSRSLDLGGFVEEIAPGAFDDVLARNPDVHLLWDHDTRLVLARTSNNTLKLKENEVGLNYWGRVAPTSYASDLRVLLDRGDIDQASFAFTVGEQEWTITTDQNGDERVLRRINQVAELYDCTITACGAYPAASSGVARMHVRSYAGLEPAEVPRVVATSAASDAAVPSGRVRVARARARARARAVNL